MNSMQIANAAHLKEQMVRYGFFLPKTKAFCTIDYMNGVLNGTYYAPTFTSLKLRPCPRPPSKEALLAEIQKNLRRTH